MKFIATKKGQTTNFSPFSFLLLWIREPRSGIRNKKIRIRLAAQQTHTTWECGRAAWRSGETSSVWEGWTVGIRFRTKWEHWTKSEQFQQQYKQLRATRWAGIKGESTRKDDRGRAHPGKGRFLRGSTWAIGDFTSSKKVSNPDPQHFFLHFYTYFTLVRFVVDYKHISLKKR